MAELLAVGVAGKILKAIADILEIKDEIIANKNRSLRLIGRIRSLEPTITSIQNNNRSASIEVINGLLKTIEDSYEYLCKFRKKLWLSKFLYRQNIKDDFLELNDRITGHIGDLNLNETIHGQELQQQLEDDRIQDDEEMKDQIAKLMDISKDILDGHDSMK